jgi:hypothetical protein
MTEDKDEAIYVRVRDLAGNEFVCPIGALKSPTEVSAEELDHCVDDATVKRYSGNIRVEP